VFWPGASSPLGEPRMGSPSNKNALKGSLLEGFSSPALAETVHCLSVGIFARHRKPVNDIPHFI
jgi:hypothetical protein